MLRQFGADVNANLPQFKPEIICKYCYFFLWQGVLVLC